MPKIALYLAGGGARGAYQAGVLKAISHILKRETIPFATISGVSVGCINAAILAQYADNFPLAVEKLEDLWSNIRCQDIFNASNYQLVKSVMRNISHIFVKNNQTGYLLDTTPLHKFIDKHIQFEKIKTNILNHRLETMEVISNCYETQQTISFYEHDKPEFDDWQYPRHMSQRTTLGPEHLIASSALPLFFPPVPIDGLHYGDGGMGLVAPLRGAVRCKVDKILILGTRQVASFPEIERFRHGKISFAHILGSMLNGLFLDNLDRDIEMVNRMNEIVRLISLWNKRRSTWRPIETLHLRPSENVSSMAQDKYLSMSVFLRFFLNVLGAKSHSGDLLSFLLFEKEFTVELMNLGYSDTMASADVITTFFE